MLALPVLAFILTWAAIRAAAPGRPLRVSFLYAVTALSCFAVAWVEILSLVGALTPAGVFAGWLAVGLMSGAAVVRHRATLRDALSIERWTMTGDQESRSTAVVTGPLVAATVMIAIVTLYVALVAAPNNYDSLTYHLSRVAHWRANGSVALYASSITRQLHMAPGAEYLVTHLYLLGDGDRWVNLVQWGAFVGCVVGVSLLARALGAGGRGQALSALLAATIPMAVLQATSTQNDCVASLWVVAGVTFGLRALRDDSRADELALAGAVGLAAVTKPTTALFLAPFALAWLVVRVRRREVGPIARQLAAAAIAITVLAGPHLTRVAGVWGCPLGPGGEAGEDFAYAVESMNPVVAVSGAIRNLSLHLATPWASVNSRFEDLVVNLHHRAGVDPSDPRTTWTGAEFGIRGDPRDEDQAGAPLLLGLFSVAVLAAVLFRRRSPELVFVVCVVGGFLLFSTVLKWQPWHGRLHLPLLFIATVVCGRRIASMSRAALPAVVAVIALISVRAPLLENHRRPLLGPVSILTEERIDQYLHSVGSGRDSWRRVAGKIGRLECTDVGLAIHLDDPEYLLWVASPEIESVRSLRHVFVGNPSSRLESPELPCAIVYSKRRRGGVGFELLDGGYELFENTEFVTIWVQPGVGETPAPP